MKATWHQHVLADGETITVEGRHYFRNEDIDWDLLEASEATSRCPWKGKASYFHVVAGDDTNPDAAFTYGKPWPLAKRKIAGRTAFWRGVEVTD